MEEKLKKLLELCQGTVSLTSNPHLSAKQNVRRYLIEEGQVLINNPSLEFHVIERMIDLNEVHKCEVIYKRALVIKTYGSSLEDVINRMYLLIARLDRADVKNA